MPINTISLITGALSFSAALSWNKAISDIFQVSSNGASSSLLQAIIITILIMITVMIINTSIHFYTKYRKLPLSDYVITSGKNNNKVSLW
jgi:hypothetical protein